MINVSWRPRVVCYAERCDESMVYFAPHDQVVIEGQVALQQAVLHHCTGHNSTTEIAAILSEVYGDAPVLQLLEALHEQRVVVDSKNCWEAFHPYTCNPMPFGSALTDEESLSLVYEGTSAQNGVNEEHERDQQSEGGLADLLVRRRSHRLFTGHGIGVDKLAYLVWCAYGQTSLLLGNTRRRTVPSAGGLYPIKIHVVIRISCGSFDPGIYCLDQDTDALVCIRKWKSSDHEEFLTCFLADSYVRSYTACVAVSATFERQTVKYSNRGYRFAILEAGHAVQNLLLASVEQGIGSVEVGGFVDEQLSEVLKLDQDTFPLTTVFLGTIDPH